MSDFTRRAWIAGLASGVSGLAMAQPSIDSAIVQHHDEGVERNLAAQITDPGHRAYGSLPDPNELYNAGAAGGLLDSYTAGFLCPQSRFHDDRLLMERMKMAGAYLDRRQHPDGFIDLLETNFDSPPDTGFVVHNVATAACLAHRAANRELAAISEGFLRRAAAGMATGGVHTPNHRWVICSALAQVNQIFPDPAYVRRIDQWLAEGIDIDEDGQYTERSTSVYNTVCDRAFVVMAEKLKRPQLLEPVRRNLGAMMYLMHADFEVVTEISRRQDRDQRANMSRYWFPLRYLAVKDGNGQFAAVAQAFTPAAASLSALMEYPEIAGPLPALAPPPDDFEKEMRVEGIVRFRRGTTSATLLAESPTLFTLRHGKAVIESVRFASAFFGKGQFEGTSIERSGGSYVMREALDGPYYQPLDPPRRVPAGEWGRMREGRRQSPVGRLEQTVTLSEIPHGFRLRIQAHGTRGVPLAVEINLRDGGKLDGTSAGWDGAALLGGGQYGSLTVEADRIRFGPGLRQHAYTHVRGALPRPPGRSVYLTAFTPVDHTIEFTCE